jgi:hypothetical protein
MKTAVIEADRVQAAVADPALENLAAGPAKELLASLVRREYGDSVALIVVYEEPNA